MLAYSALGKLRADPNNAKARTELEQYGDDLGYALLLKRIRPDIENATQADITKAAWGTVPWRFSFGHSASWSGVAFFFILLFGLAFYLVSTGPILRARWLLWAMVFTPPLPWIAAQCKPHHLG